MPDAYTIAVNGNHPLVAEILGDVEKECGDKVASADKKIAAAEGQLANLNNYVNLYAGSAPSHRLGGQELRPIGGNSGFLGLPGDATPPSRFVRAAFYRATAPQRVTGYDTVLQCFHLLNNFDVPIGIEHKADEVPDLISATQWTSAIDLTNRKVYYKTMYNNSIRCIDLAKIDFGKVEYQVHPLDKVKQQPIEEIEIN